jgi:glucose/arabinose dehydrogenase
MMQMWLKVMLLVLAVVLVGCGGQPATEEPAAEQEMTTAEPEPEVTTEGDVVMVEVPAEGVELDPPVEVVQLPDGVWYCDMGTVHYARAEKGDGICPLCQMELVHKVAEGEAMPEGAHGEGEMGHEGHEHGEG